MTMNDHWGYNSHDRNWKSTADLVRKLVDIASKGGNFLLNVGPTSAGRFPPEAIERLEAIGSWMDVNGEAIHGTMASPIADVPWGRITTKTSENGTTLYLCVFDWPADGRLVVPGLGNAPRGARLLADRARSLGVAQEEASVVVRLPGKAPDAIASVVALEIEGAPLVYRAPRIHASAPIFMGILDVEIDSGSPALEARYTLDGSMPNEHSPLYQNPIRIGETMTIRARSFHQGKPVSEVTEAKFQHVFARPGLAVENVAPGLALTTYAGNWDQIPDFGSLPVRSQRVARTVGISGDLAAERVGARFEGFLAIEGAKVYEIALTSDDGSRLYVDGELAIDSDGLHSSLERRATLALGTGLHSLRLEWFNKTGGSELALAIAPSGEKLLPVPAGALVHLP
jgi:alpha-L-fucosidase